MSCICLFNDTKIQTQKLQNYLFHACIEVLNIEEKRLRISFLAKGVLMVSVGGEGGVTEKSSFCVTKVNTFEFSGKQTSLLKRRWVACMCFRFLTNAIVQIKSARLGKIT